MSEEIEVQVVTVEFLTILLGLADTAAMIIGNTTIECQDDNWQGAAMEWMAGYFMLLQHIAGGGGASEPEPETTEVPY